MDRFNINCRECVHEDTDECDECSMETMENYGCSCHITPPCSFCADLNFEEHPNLHKYPREKNILEQCVDAGFVIIMKDDLGKVVCDFCDKDWSNSDQSGGFLFQSKAVCPDCEPRFMDRVKQHHEQSFIRDRCPEEQSFSEWIKNIRRRPE